MANLSDPWRTATTLVVRAGSFTLAETQYACRDHCAKAVNRVPCAGAVRRDIRRGQRRRHEHGQRGFEPWSTQLYLDGRPESFLAAMT
jgi:hypothetical protein